MQFGKKLTDLEAWGEKNWRKPGPLVLSKVTLRNKSLAWIEKENDFYFWVILFGEGALIAMYVNLFLTRLEEHEHFMKVNVIFCC